MKQTEPETKILSVGGMRLCLHEWPAAAGRVKATVLLLHATGFHGRCWDRIAAGLSDYRVLAWDMRGHGGSEKTGPYSWGAFQRDLEHLLDLLGLEQVIGVGHSFGGWCVTMAAATRPAAFQRLCLLDPVILPPELYLKNRQHEISTPDHQAVSKRRNEWRSWQEMYERFKNRKPFNRWLPDILADYCRHGLMANPNGEGYVLACPPEIEASIYAGKLDTDIHEHISNIQIPATVLRAPAQDTDQQITDFSGSPTWPGLADAFPDCQDVFLPERTHFIPMEAPDLVISHILDAKQA